ncbi:hypothetical protein GUITHDRAFT_165628 [Guillardia theta CCMP2712]|uniref:Uncharacterized protein n=1 Tax=Guillardia theta (strain CCMP2712) TaxID=905079 RepID=L1IM12_GUITC|nr:hypothetical protein GUITHDRAFT_165628 [Guillardia theta CCMP2712]EKX36939.1 hypothetical protein GUITHDRAFT_165628 [Guillardia theta CCMP2712]|eukprot:XP_005823919.1 hypothetical protein GUITHDRAFT_165628 [Guillardia theta CCMP2712]
MPSSSKHRAMACLMLGLGAAAVTLIFRDGNGTQDPVSDTMDKNSEQFKRMFRGSVDFEDYPTWTKTVDQINEVGKVNHGVWTYYKGPPFLQRVTMYSGNDVDITRAGNLIRKVLGLPKNFGKWEGSSYIENFGTQQMRFLQSNRHSVLVIPPLSEGNRPILSDEAKARLRHYISVGHNTLIICGGPANVDFINSNLLPQDGGTLLEQAWTRGPYEKQEAAIGTPFQTLPVTLPNDMNHAHGVRLSSLPMDAVSYFETAGVSVVFGMKFGSGQALFLGFDFSLLSKPWIKTLIAGMEFAS